MKFKLIKSFMHYYLILFKAQMIKICKIGYLAKMIFKFIIFFGSFTLFLRKKIIKIYSA